jgi:hypothetical protein
MKAEFPNEDQADLDHIARLIRLANERGDFVRTEDGYTCYWPSEASRGALPAWALRVLANEMEKRDETWDAIIQGDHRVGPGCLQVWKWDDAPEEWKKLSTSDGDEDWLALVPLRLLPETANGVAPEPDLWWMHWAPERLKRYTLPNLEGFEIWIGAHA